MTPRTARRTAARVAGWLGGWRLALRVARRDLLRDRVRAIIALVMVTLPVLGVIAADILMRTSEVSAAEGIDRRIGTVATAEVRIAADGTQVFQGADPGNGWGNGDPLPRPTTFADIERVVGQRSTALAPQRTEVLVRTSEGREAVSGAELDPAARLARGLYRLDGGRWPTATDEVVVNQALRDEGVGRTVTMIGRGGEETTRTVVGTVVDATVRSRPVVVGLPGSLPEAGWHSAMDGEGWLVDGPPITWEQVERLNALGAFVTDRHLVTHPDEAVDVLDYDSGADGTADVVALVVVMALIEVVLLAGPAFAVGARKQQRTLALLASSGGTPTQGRRVILAGGLLLGLSAAFLGVLGGIGAGWLLQPLAQRLNSEWLGPFEVPWLHLVGVAAFGLVSALLACLVPAWIASRQNVVAVLAGRRGDAKPVRAFPLLGVLLFLVGTGMAFLGARHSGLTVAWSAVVCVLGMVLLVPVVVGAVARLAGRLPLPVRFAARDAVRHRTRTTPAVAAVAATVAGVVALGIAWTSDEKQNRETYQASLLMGDAAVTPSYDYFTDGSETVDWEQVAEVVARHAPDARVAPVAGVRQQTGPDTWTGVSFLDPTARAGDEGWVMPFWSTSTIGSEILVSDGTQLPALVTEAAPDAARDLAAGRAVVFTGEPEQAALDRVTIAVQEGNASGTQPERRLTVPATVVPTQSEVGTVRAVLPAAVARQAGLAVATVGLDLTQPGLSERQEKELRTALQGLATPATIYVERGYQASSEAAIVQWVLAGLAAVLMLGGTLTAMFLALSDARPDLATLAAVGAPPRTRRRVASAYTFVVAFGGAVLGMLVGFVPGIAITWPLTRADYPGSAGAYIDIPWLLIAGVVVGLPILTALVVGACIRSRLPMVTRLT